jgi:putative membrane protein
MRMGAAPSSVVTSTTPFTSVERDFVTRVAAKEVYEIEVSKLAVEKAASPLVRDLAQTMVTNHARMNQELVEIMSAHGVPPPKGLPADRATKLHRLAALPRSDAFDNGYVRVVGIEDHKAAIQMYEKAQKNVHDRDLRAYIDRSLTILRMHLTLAQQTAAGMAG